MYREQKARCDTETKPPRSGLIGDGAMSQLFDHATILPQASGTAKSTSVAAKAEPSPAVADNTQRQEAESEGAPQEIQRDSSVPDEIWTKLQADIRANGLAEEKSQKAIADLAQQVERAVGHERTSEQELTAPEQAAKAHPGEDDDAEMDEQKRRHEQARIRAIMACRARQEAEEKLRKAREEEERKRKEEAKAQKKLREMGVCPMGFRWIKQHSGLQVCRRNSFRLKCTTWGLAFLITVMTVKAFIGVWMGYCFIQDISGGGEQRTFDTVS